MMSAWVKIYLEKLRAYRRQADDGRGLYFTAATLPVSDLCSPDENFVHLKRLLFTFKDVCST